ncbi:MAG TPA: hypothetical protein VKA96_00005, partial [Solirubrobacteraceae bacterium]|nr:hypothetical protein [Solirubrobacteraceae bacterium]
MKPRAAASGGGKRKPPAAKDGKARSRKPPTRTAGNGAPRKRTARAPKSGRGASARSRSGGGTAVVERAPVGVRTRAGKSAPQRLDSLSTSEARLLGDLFAIVEEHADEARFTIDRDAVEAAFLFSCEHHADQRRRSGEDFITHPVGVAKVCAGMRL